MPSFSSAELVSKTRANTQHCHPIAQVQEKNQQTSFPLKTVNGKMQYTTTADDDALTP